MKKLVILFILLTFTQSASATKYTGLREISPKVEISASLNKDPKDKNTGVDSNFHKFNMKVEMPESVRSGDYFNVELRGIPSSDFDNMDIRANDKEKTKIGRVFKVDENINARDVQFTKDHPLFNSIKPEQSGDWRKFQFIFDENVEKIKNIKFEIGFENKYQGFAVANRSYEVPIFVKVGGEEKYTSKALVGEWYKYQYHNNLRVRSMDVELLRSSYLSSLNSIFEWSGDMTSRTVSISIKGGGVVFSGVKGYAEGDTVGVADSFFYGKSNMVSEEGLISDFDRGLNEFKIIKIGEDNIELEVISQSTPEGVNTGINDIQFEVKDLDELSKNGKKVDVKYEVKNKGATEYSKEYSVDIKVKNNTYTYSDKKDSLIEGGGNRSVNDWVLPVVGVLIFLAVSGLVAYVAIYISKKKNSKS